LLFFPFVFLSPTFLTEKVQFTLQPASHEDSYNIGIALLFL
jgi:hypothetical protein